MSGSKVSKRYAKALLSLGQEDGNFKQYGQELSGFVGIWQSQSELRTVMSSPVFPLKDRRKILQSILAKGVFSAVAKNFLDLLLEKNRIELIKEIGEHYQKLEDEILNVTHAEVITAKPLKNEAQNRLIQVLEGFTSKKVKIGVREDQSLLGGMIVKIGDLVIDGSIKSQLRGLKETLKRGESI